MKTFFFTSKLTEDVNEHVFHSIMERQASVPARKSFLAAMKWNGNMRLPENYCDFQLRQAYKVITKKALGRAQKDQLYSDVTETCH